MKKFFLLIAGFLLCVQMTAQQDEVHRGFSRGDMFVSGMVSYQSASRANHTKEKTFTFAPRMGYFINDFFAFGGQLGYIYNSVKASGGAKIAKNNTFTIDAFGRYYLLPGSKFSPYGELSIGFGTTEDIDHHRTNGVNAALSPGLSYFLGHHFALEASFGILSYHSVQAKGENGSTDSFKVGIDLEDINFGILFKF